MARSSILHYYFVFRENATVPYRIKATLINIDTDKMPMYVAFTTEQLAFYQENPTATVVEVWNCELTPPYVPPAPELTEYIALKVVELEKACKASISVISLEYAMANACLAGTSILYSGNKYYTINEAKAVMKRFMDESCHAMQVLNTYKTQIESAQTRKAVDEAYNEAINELNAR